MGELAFTPPWKHSPIVAGVMDASRAFESTSRLSQGNRHAADMALVKRVLAGESAARTAFAERIGCLPAIIRSKQERFNLDADDIDEVVQNAFLAIWIKLPTFRGSSKLETWAYGYCIYELFKWRERRNASRERPAEDPRELSMPRLTSETPTPALDRLSELVDHLGIPAGPIIHLKHFDDLTFEEIGLRLEISPNTAKTQYYRAVRQLRELLLPGSEEDEG